MLQEKGIRIKIGNKSYTVKFQLILILGDKLGLNGLFGFVESFTANYFCRICRASSEETAIMIEKNQTLLRNSENYEADVKLGNSSCTGIKSQCVFHKITNFHVTENLTIDMMHDILEGVCVYVIKSIINIFITVERYFTLEELNARIENFDYGFTECSNKPPPLYYNSTTCEYNVNTSAAEMLCLVRYLGLIIGDLIPQNNKHWQLYLYLRQIVDIVTSPRLTKSMLRDLQILVRHHNELYINLFERLKPKFHNLVHYARILFKNGPCVNFWSMRYESFHRLVKANAVSTNCNKNLLVTIANKQILQMCNTNINYNMDAIILGPLDVDNLHEIHTSDLDSQSRNTKEYYKQVEINGTTYRLSTFLVTDMQKSETEIDMIILLIFI